MGDVTDDDKMRLREDLQFARALHDRCTASQRLFAAEREQQAPTRRAVVGRERALQVRLVR